MQFMQLSIRNILYIFKSKKIRGHEDNGNVTSNVSKNETDSRKESASA